MEQTFWNFSLGFYGLRGVAAACLRCQDEAGADVNLMLFLLWRAASGVRVGESEVTALDERVRFWRERVVRPLRAIRRDLKGAAMPDFEEAGLFRERVKALELEAERLEQEALSRRIVSAERRHPTLRPAEAADHNIHAYAAFIRRELPQDAVDDLLRAFACASAQPTSS